MRHTTRLTTLHWMAIALIAAVVTACASIGRPDGGPRDEKPPVFVTSNPAPGAVRVDRQQIDIFFDENVQLEDAFNKVVVSPAQKNNPRVSSNGRRVKVLLQDSLIPNTTYTIDFADAIKDLNEGNKLDGFATYFSTGDSIDTLSISGMVLQARNLEPAQGMLVGVYSNLADTAIRTLPLERIARTNQLGQFSVLNLKPGQYRIYALNDLNRDFHWDRSEDVAFYDVTLEPRVEAITVTDTLRSATNQDSLAERRGYAYYPNDVLLTWFNEDYKSQYLKDYKRPERHKITLNMAAPADTLPQITIASELQRGRNIDQWTVLQKNATLDSLTYWIVDSTVMAVDSLLLSVKYQATDTADMLAWKTDTLKFFYKDMKKKEKKKKDAAADTLPPPKVFAGLSPETSATHDIYLPVVLKSEQPIDTFDLSGIKLEMLKDTLWVEQKGFKVETDSLSPLLKRRVNYAWTSGAKYRLTVDSASMKNVYGLENKPFKFEFQVKDKERYSNITFNVQGIDSCGVVEVLDTKDEPIRVVPVVDGKAVVKYLNPGTVYARIFIDRNQNGEWDTGNLIDSVQPEEVYYYPKKIALKENWDVSIDWNIYEIPVDMQKPYEIKKNRPKLKKGEKAPNSHDDEEEEEDIFNTGLPGASNNPYDAAKRGRR